MCTTMLLEDVIKSDNKFVRSKFQAKDFSYVKITIIPVQEATITPFLYDIGNGRVFGENTVVDVHFFDAKYKRKDIEILAANFTISAFPWIRNLLFCETIEEALAEADYVVLNPVMSRKKLSFKYAMLDQAPFFSIIGQHIESHVRKTAWVIVVTPSYTSLFCGILKDHVRTFPANRITGLKSHIQVLAKNMIANRLSVSPDQVRGITVWGENIIDFQMTTVNIPHTPAMQTTDQSCNTGGGDSKEPVKREENNEERPTCSQLYTSKEKSANCQFCKDTQHFKQRRMQLSSENKLKDSSYECSPKSETSVEEKCTSVKALQDEIMAKIQQHLKVAKSQGRRSSMTKCIEKELLELYQSVPNSTTETKYYLNVQKGNVSVIPVTQVVTDLYWLLKYLPRVCLKGSSSPGGSLARCLAEHVAHLHGGSKKPFSLMAAADDAYEFPRGLYVSGPGIVDKKTGTIAFFPLYEMSEDTQLKLFRQVAKLKKQYLQLKNKFWANEEEAFDTKKMPLLEKDEFGIAKSSTAHRRHFDFSAKKKPSLFASVALQSAKPSSTVSSLARIIQYHEQQTDRLKREHEQEKAEAECKRKLNEEAKPPAALIKIEELDRKIGEILRSVLK